MALKDSQRAIGAATKLLQDHLIRRGFAVSVGRPEQAAANDAAAKINLFLYEVEFDASLRNVSPDPDRPPPLWLSLRYLVTAFDADEQSDSADAHELLGRGLSALHELNFLHLDAVVALDVRKALENNPEPLKLTFEATTPDLLSKVMQGTDEKYRLSVAVQVRPVMLVPEEPPAYSLLVGINYSATPPSVVGPAAVGLAVLGSLGARLEQVEPESFAPGDTFTIRGDELHLSGLECRLGPVGLIVVGQQADRLRVKVESPRPLGAAEDPIAAGTAISAGEHPLAVRQGLPGGRFRTSSLLVAKLRPVVSSAALAAGVLTVTGLLLGTADDDVQVALYANGSVVRVFDAAATAAGQKSLTVAVAAGTVAPGSYLVIVRVNGQQAKTSPTVTV